MNFLKNKQPRSNGRSPSGVPLKGTSGSGTLRVVVLTGAFDIDPAAVAYLDSFEVDVTTVTRMDEFGQRLREAPIDLVIATPSKDGTTVEAARLIRHESGESTFIVVGAGDNPSQRDAFLDAGATECISTADKDILRIVFQRALRTQFEKKPETDQNSSIAERLRTFEEFRDFLPVPVFFKDQNGRYLGCNSAFEELFNVERTELIGKSARELFGRELCSFVEDTDGEALSRGGTIRREYAHRDHHGTWHDLVYQKTPLHGEEERIEGIVGVILDVTDEKRYARALSKALDMQTAVFNSLNQVVLSVNASTRTIELANPAVRKIFGYEPEELTGQSARVLHVDNDHYRSFAVEGNPRLENDGIFRTVQPFRRKDSSVFLADVSVTELHPDFGWQAGVVTVINDISDRVASQEALVEKTKELETILENAPDLIIRADSQQRVHFANSRTRDFFGIAPEEAVGRTITDLGREVGIPESILDAWNESSSLVFRQEQSDNVEMDMRLQGRRLFLQTRVVPEFDSSGKIRSALSITRDVTMQKEAEEALREREEQLSHSQRMEQVGQLAGGVAHDFNNLLTAIQGYLTLADADETLSESAQKMMANIRKTTGRAAHLTQQLLLFSRKAPTEKKNTDFNSAVEGICKMLGRVVPESIEIRTNLDPTVGELYADQGKLEQVVMNLIINARDAVGGRGVISVETAPGRSDEPGGSYVEFRVTDDGKGMDETTRDRVFEPFYTTKVAGQGTGLGLSVVHGIVREHNGRIDVESAPGVGTTFTVRLPQGRPMENRKEEEQRVPADRTGNGELVRIVEDDPASLETLRGGLVLSGYEPVTASTLSETRELLEQLSEPPAAAIVDMVLTDGTALDCIPLIKARQKECKIIVASGYLDNHELVAKVKEEGFTFLQKPYSMGELIETLKRELRTAGGTDR